MIITSLVLEDAGFDHGFGTRRTAPREYPEDIHILMQVHGERIVILTDMERPGRGKWGHGSGVSPSRTSSPPLLPPPFGVEVKMTPLPGDPFRFEEGDALLTDIPETYVGIRTADCLPVLVADPITGAVAAIHCGWRSAVRSLAEKGVRALAGLTGSPPAGFVAAVGPGIGPCHYEVGEEVKEAFAAAGQDTGALFERRGQSLYLDLPWACTLQMQAAGVRVERIDDLEECTVCRNDLYYSWRAEKGEERMVSFIAAGSAR